MKRTTETRGKRAAKTESKTTAVTTRRDFYEGVLYCAKQTARCEARRLADLLEQSKEATAGEIREAAWAAGQSASWLSGWAGWDGLNWK
jgi:hypothetical protein